MTEEFDPEKLKKSLFSLSATGTEEGPVLDNILGETAKSGAYKRHVRALANFRKAQKACAENADEKHQSELGKKNKTLKHSCTAIERLMGIDSKAKLPPEDSPADLDRSAPDYALSEVLIKAHREALEMG